MQQSQRCEVRAATLEDLRIILDIQAASYPAHILEDYDVFASMIKAYPQGCFVACDSENHPLGYSFSFPSKRGETKALNSRKSEEEFLKKIEKKWKTDLGDHPHHHRSFNCMYLHDLAIAQKARKRGISHLLYAAVDKQTRQEGYSCISLVAVEGAEKFWHRVGFVGVSPIQYTSAHRPDLYMEKLLPSVSEPGLIDDGTQLPP